MNPTEPDAIATDTIDNTLAKPPQSLGTFLDRLYGTLFLPSFTFEQLKADPSFKQAAFIVALVNVLESLRLSQVGIISLIGASIGGLVGWLFFTFLLKQLASAFQKEVSMPELLTLTGFASLPWVFMAPALSLPPRLRLLAAIAVIIWFITWQIWSTSIALSIKSWKTLAIIPLAISGGVVALIWLGNTFKILFSIL
ncbi:MAG: hypothetical protein DCE90_02520 [Pseudanabaena sp.]|nr:MAG: hypothetical protein DCE90_02520 [Pseudanabaena sp.]